jgi:hypothetical protein
MNMLYAELDMAKLQEVWKGDGNAPAHHNP